MLRRAFDRAHRAVLTALGWDDPEPRVRGVLCHSSAAREKRCGAALE